jgi:hypothetical protein
MFGNLTVISKSSKNWESEVAELFPAGKCYKLLLHKKHRYQYLVEVILLTGSSVWNDKFQIMNDRMLFSLQ